MSTGEQTGDNLLIIDETASISPSAFSDLVYRGDYVDRAVLLPAIVNTARDTTGDWNYMNGTATITQEEYQKLLEDQAELNGLKARGVDNWEGYGDA